MSSDDRHENEDFNLEIDSAVESFFAHYEENAPKMDASSNEPESDAILDHLFNSLTEAILTVDWEVNDASVNEAREILEKIQANFPILRETRTQEVIDGMLRTLDAIAASPQRVSTSATAQLEKAIPILRGIASGAQMADGYDELIEDAIAGLEACRAVDPPAEGGEADLPDLMTHDGIPFDIGDNVTSKTEGLEPIAVPVGVSLALCNHSEVVAQLTPRARRLSDLYESAQGSEKALERLQKICGLLELQTRSLQDAFSLNCNIAIFPIGEINNLSDFLGFQRMAMGVCLKHARVLEKGFKQQPHRKRFRQSIYFLRIAMERQMDELSRAAMDGDASDQNTETTVPPLL